MRNPLQRMHASIPVRILAAFTLMVPLLLACQQSDSKESGGIFGKRWGSSLRDYPDFTFLAQDGETKYYTKENDAKKLGETEIGNIVYGFYKDHLYTALVYFDSMEKFNKIKDTLSQQYGAPYQPDQSAAKFFWANDKLNILLSFDDTSNQGRVSYFFLPIQNQIEEGAAKNTDKGEAKKE